MSAKVRKGLSGGAVVDGVCVWGKASVTVRQYVVLSRFWERRWKCAGVQMVSGGNWCLVKESDDCGIRCLVALEFE